MAPPIPKPDPVAQRLKIVRLEDGVEDPLEEALLKWLEPFVCPPELERDALFCVSKAEVARELGRITADRYIEATEATYLFKIVNKLAGSDRLLTRQEVTSEALKKKVEEVAKEEELPPDFLQSTRYVERGSHLLIFKPDDTRWLQANGRLQEVDRLVTDMIPSLEETKTRLITRDEGFFSLIRAENLWGLSIYLTRDGKPFHEGEAIGLERTIRAMGQTREGIEQVKKGLVDERLEVEKPEARQFLQGPLTEAAGLRYALGEDRPKDVPSEEFRRQIFGRWTLDLLRQCDALEAATYVQATVGERLGFPTEPSENWFEYLSGSAFRGFANSLVSLDSIALGFVGRYAAWTLERLLPESRFLCRLLLSSHRWMWLLPGGALRCNLALGIWSGIGHAVVNLVMEIAKFEACRQIGYRIGDEAGGRWAGRLYMFFGGFINALPTRFYSRLAMRLQGNQPSALLDDLSTSTNCKEEIARLCEAMGPYASAPRGFGLTRGESPETLASLIGRRGFKIQTEYVEARREVQGALNRLATLDRDSFQVARQLARGEDPRKALGAVREILERVEGEAVPKPPIRPPSRVVTPSRGRRVRRETPPEPRRERRPSPPSTPTESRAGPSPPPSVRSALELAIENPPTSLDDETIRILTDGRISAANAAVQRELAYFYERHPAVRRTLLRTLQSLLSHKTRTALPSRRPYQVDKMGALAGARKERVRDWRLFYELEDGAIRLLGIRHRGRMPWSES